MSISNGKRGGNRKTLHKLAALIRFDRKLLAGEDCPEDGCLVGLDEVGRGSLIGPVAAAAVWLPEDLPRSDKRELCELNDSKQLTASRRAALSACIHRVGRVGIGLAEKDEVDRLNVHYASLLALYRAYRHLGGQWDYAGRSPFLVMDGRSIIPDLPMHCQKAVVKGDGKSAVIAAASVVAKHYRDTLVLKLAEEYPGYGWETNMGYGTPEHQEAIRRLGVTPLHRRNYRAVQEQLSLALE